MPLVVTHSATSDNTFSAQGAAAWDAAHVVSGLAAIATSGAYADLSGTPSINSTAFGNVGVTGQGTIGATTALDTLQIIAGANITLTTNTGNKSLQISAVAAASQLPIGFVFISTASTDPNTLLGYGTWTALGAGKVLVGFQTGSADFGTAAQTGGVTGIAAVGTVSQPVFTGDSYTPSGTNAVVQYEPSGTNAVVQFTPSGTNAISLMRDAVSGTNAASQVTGSVSVNWPTGVPTFAGTTATASVSVTWPTAVPTAAAVTVSASVTWPTGVPVFGGIVHRHELPILHTENSVIRFLATSIFGVGVVSRVEDVKLTVTNVVVVETTVSGNVMLSNSATASGTNTWPATAPTAVQSASHTHTIGWPASVPSAVQSAGFVPAGVISWPATAPSAALVSGTAVAQIFTGVTASVSGQVFTGIDGTVSGQVFTGITGTVSGQVFTGVGKAATGTVSKPTFVGDLVSNLQPYLVCYFFERTA